MPQCPNCNANIEENFGMVMCPSCGTAVFIDIYGNLQVASSDTRTGISDHFQEDVESEDAEISNPLSSEESFSLSVPEESTDEDFENTAYEIAPVEDEAIELNPPQSEVSNNYITEVAAEESLESENQFFGHTTSTELNDSVIPENEDQLGGSTEEMVLFDPNAFLQNEMQNVPITAKETIGEIQEFGNSVSKDGISYFLRISNIDTSEVRKELLEELRDARFGWNIQDVAAKIKKGELYFEDINPVSASILVNRLKSLNLDITWGQNV